MWKVREDSQHKWSGESDKHYPTLFLSQVQEWFDVLYKLLCCCCLLSSHSTHNSEVETKKWKNKNPLRCKHSLVEDGSVFSRFVVGFIECFSSCVGDFTFYKHKKIYISKSVAQKKSFLNIWKKFSEWRGKKSRKRKESENFCGKNKEWKKFFVSFTRERFLNVKRRKKPFYMQSLMPFRLDFYEHSIGLTKKLNSFFLHRTGVVELTVFCAIARELIHWRIFFLFSKLKCVDLYLSTTIILIISSAPLSKKKKNQCVLWILRRGQQRVCEIKKKLLALSNGVIN